MLLPVSLLPYVLGISGKVYLFGAAVLGLLFLYSSIRAAMSLSAGARKLFWLLYLFAAFVFILMVVNR